MVGVCLNFLIMGYGRMIERIAKESGGFWSQFGAPIGAILVGVGIFCWLRRTAALHVWFWRTAHAIIGLTLVVSLAISLYLAFGSAFISAGKVFMVTFILVPGFYALFQYSYRSSDVWSKSHQ